MTFMQNAKETVRLEKCHYQISLILPFKNCDILVPNNKTPVLQRAGSLNERLQRDPKFCEDYKAFMEDMLIKGYARKAHALV